MTYLEDLAEKSIEVAKVLEAKNVMERFRRFDAAPDPAEEKIRIPGQAQTKFQMEQAQGNWAEGIVRSAIDASPAYMAIPFGDNDETKSQDSNFREQYLAGKKREREFGKRCDFLLFKAAPTVPKSAWHLSGPEAEETCKTCLAGLEIRSSRTSADKFIAYQKAQLAEGKKPAKMEPSFTVKTEDLEKVYRWAYRNDKPVLYVQVLFDSIHAINFTSIFKFIIAKGTKLKLEYPTRSGKHTIFIPLSHGKRIGEVTAPEFEARHNPLDNGRHDVFAVPVGGGAVIRMDDLLSLL